MKRAGADKYRADKISDLKKGINRNMGVFTRNDLMEWKKQKERQRNSCMELTKSQKLLINGLKLFKVELDEVIGIMLLMKTEEQQWELMDWMAAHLEATPSDILGKAMEMTR